eukprot:6474030-Amphidinium_carterae.1
MRCQQYRYWTSGRYPWLYAAVLIRSVETETSEQSLEQLQINPQKSTNKDGNEKRSSSKQQQAR